MADAEDRAEWRSTPVADPAPEGYTAWRRETETQTDILILPITLGNKYLVKDADNYRWELWQRNPSVAVLQLTKVSSYIGLPLELLLQDHKKKKQKSINWPTQVPNYLNI